MQRKIRLRIPMTVEMTKTVADRTVVISIRIAVEIVAISIRTVADRTEEIVTDRIVTDRTEEAVTVRITDLTEETDVTMQEVIVVKEDNRPTAGITETLITEIETVLRAIKIVTIIKVAASLVTGTLQVIRAVRDEMEGRQINSEITNKIHSWTHR